VSTLRWRVHLGTAGATWVRLAVPSPPPGAPWTVARAVEALRTLGATPQGRPDVLGSGRGEPLLARHDLVWRSVPVHLECNRHRAGTGEVAVELPPWDDLVAYADIDENDVWDLIDAVAAAVGARHGGLGDEDAAIPDDEAQPGRRLLARLVHEDVAGTGAPGGWSRHAHLQASGLVVLLR
jgi:hypothetical protein